MSGLWTPGGEHRPSGAAARRDPGSGEDDLDTIDDDGYDDATEAAMLAELEDARQRLAGVPAAQVVANHAMGLFELGAIHLSQQPPHLSEATLAIDAMAAVVEGLGERLGPNASVLRDALAQIRLAFVSLKTGSGTSDQGKS